MKNRKLGANFQLRRSFARSFTGLVAGASLPVVGLAAGCGQEQAQDPLATGDAFVAIARNDVSSQALGLRKQALGTLAAPDINEAGVGQDFYLAINRKELSGKYFLSSYLKQAFPGAVSYGAATSLGTRVVSFKIQNGKLFVFDVGDGKKTSDTFDPELVIEAYPLVQNYAPFERLPGSKNYVLIDPSAGRNRFSVLTDSFNGPTYGRFSIELSFLQRFRKIGDGVTYEQIFAGYSEGPDANSGSQGEPNQFRSSGTLGIALRRYSEGEGFAQYEPGEMDAPYFFTDDPLIVPNSGTTQEFANKWNVVIDPMTKKLKSKPIEWIISDHIDSLKADPRFAGVDIEGAMRKGVENWNKAFGAEVLKARKARPDESFGDDDKNYVLFDEDPSYGAAFANWRSNPNTGEIRGSSVYFSSLWVEIADQIFEDDMALRRPITPRQRPTAPTIVWDAMKPQETCTLWALPYRLKGDGDERIPGGGSGDKSLTKKQKTEQYITHVLVHEIGHTLGLRHNFKGSLKYQGEDKTNSSSVMEYIDDFDAVYSSEPGTYDIDAIKLLYGLSDKKPTDAFCTDENTRQDPDCATFDRRANPLVEYYAPTYAQVASDFLNSRSPTAPNTTLNNMADYVRAGATGAIRLDAWNRIITGVKAPLTPMQIATPGYAARADLHARRIISRLYIDAANLRGRFTNDPPADAALTTAILAEIRGNLLNVDGVRTFTTRRVMVDVLKKLQTSAAYGVLKEGRDAVAMAIPGLMGDQKALAEDLLARIDKAIQPYFNN